MARPFLKWVGGKTKLLPEILKIFPKEYLCYHEPFLGGGAVFFALKPKAAILSDSNKELIITYKVVQQNVEELISKLNVHEEYNDKDYYYEVRAKQREYATDIAARMIYLNKTCFNGLYRVNSKGEFNASWGYRKNPTIVDSENLRACSQALKDTLIQHADFSDVLRDTVKGDLVYCDPPYYDEFAGYTADSFDKLSHNTLATMARTAAHHGVHMVLSNSKSSFTKRLYKGFKTKTVKTRRSINCNGKGRGEVEELLIWSKGCK